MTSLRSLRPSERARGLGPMRRTPELSGREDVVRFVRGMRAWVPPRVMTAAYCIDSDVLIWHLRSGDRQNAVEQHLVNLATTGGISCSTLSVAEVEQGVRRGEEERTRAFLR